MSEVWKKIFKDWIETYEAIDTIQCCLIEDDYASELRCKLLDDIIETLRSEVSG